MCYYEGTLKGHSEVLFEKVGFCSYMYAYISRFSEKKLCHERVHSNIFMNSLHMYMWVKYALFA